MNNKVDFNIHNINISHSFVKEYINEGNVNIIKDIMTYCRNRATHDAYYNYCINILFHYSSDEYHIFEILLESIDINLKDSKNCILIVDYLYEVRDYIQQNAHDIHKKILRMLDFIENINTTDRNGDTALNRYIRAFEPGRFKMNEDVANVIEKMMNMGSNMFNENEFNGSSILEYVIYINSYDLVNLLLKYYVSKRNINIDILFMALLHGSNYDIIELLLQYLDDLNKTDSKGIHIKNHIYILCVVVPAMIS